MPCYDGGTYESTVSQASYDVVKKRLDLATRLLCNVMTYIEHNVDIKWSTFDPDLKPWWFKHKQEDEKRLRKEASEKLAKKAKLREEIKRMKEELEKL